MLHDESVFCYPQFFHSRYLNDTSFPDGGFPPFYPKELFSKKREIHLMSPIKVAAMSQKQWYNLLLEDYCNKASHVTDLETSWRLARLKGLCQEHTSFKFKLLQKIPPTQERLQRANDEIYWNDIFFGWGDLLNIMQSETS